MACKILKINFMLLYTGRVWYGVPDHGRRHLRADADSLCERADATSGTIKDTLYEHTNWSAVVARDFNRLRISAID